MGRPYAAEMALLGRSYSRALTTDWSAIERVIDGNYGANLVSVGSGGSMTTAAWSVWLHRLVCRGAAQASTPLALRSTMPTSGRSSVWIMSGSGKNSDIRLALDTAIAAEPHQVVILCAATESPLAAAAAKYPWVRYVGFDNPAGSDGFLATNSMFASCVGLAVAYRSVASLPVLPARLEDLLARSSVQLADTETLEEKCSPLWAQDTLIVLHGTAGAVAATDIESRFTEAALNCVQPSDFRNFAHGRHHWLAKRRETSAVLAITDPETREIADRTLALIPRGIPTFRIDLDGDPIASGLASVWFAMQLAGFAGRARGIDPGRPGVPEFGRKIYNLRTKPRATQNGVSPALRRKMGDVRHSAPGGQLDRWKQALDETREVLASTSIEALVLDYDGTLVEPDDRFAPPSKAIVQQLVRLVETGVTVAIATGRGDSVRTDLRRVLPKRLWPGIVVGYHNGNEIGSLDDDGCPPNGDEISPFSERVRSALLAAPFGDLLRIRATRTQVSVEASAFSEEQLWILVHDAVLQRCDGGAKVLRSSHSVDVVEASASKIRVLDYLVQKHVAERSRILCIGDRGRWPGNDFELLDHPLGLSVDEVSSRHDACWNFAPSGERGVATALRYLSALVQPARARGKALQFRLEA